ncbi:MAG: beta-N-acetylhexosaminidase, partial [Deltaproteobacteria bacterium]|nr:beta-N-acetylhexosaminidase [Deltaproteobacteria bacterium]
IPSPISWRIASRPHHFFTFQGVTIKVMQQKNTQRKVVPQRTPILILACIVVVALGAYMVYYYLNQPRLSDQELRQQLGQMLLVGFRGTEASETSTIARNVKDLHLGGVILYDIDVPSGRTFPRNIVDPEQTRQLIADLQRSATTPLLVAADIEGGKVNRLKPKYGFPELPSAAEMGKLGPEKTRQIATDLARELADLGINFDFAPVVDLNINPDNPVIGALGRSFSDDPATVVSCAGAFVQGLHSQRIIACLKHFPGHGSSTADSHLGMVDVTSTWRTTELIPYRDLIQQGLADAVMTAHVINQEIDPDFPATLSNNFIEPILRKQLLFKGPVISDDLEMGAITQNYGFEEALIQAVNAGCDLLILSNNGSSYDDGVAARAIETLYQAVQAGKISKIRIVQSFERIRQLKADLGLVPIIQSP